MTTSSEDRLPLVPPDRIPSHVGIIMDGNGRWAKARGLPRLAGHRGGTENIRQVLRAAVEYGIQILTIYAFSTENWGRPKAEVHGLLSLIERVIDRELAELHAEGVQLRHIGREDRIPATLLDKVHEAIHLTEHNDRLIVNVAFNYGGRAEIVDAVRSIVAAGVTPGEVDEDLIRGHEANIYLGGRHCPAHCLGGTRNRVASKVYGLQAILRSTSGFPAIVGVPTAVSTPVRQQ